MSYWTIRPSPILNQGLIIYIINMHAQQGIECLNKIETGADSAVFVERVLLIVNRASATGHGTSTADRLSAILHKVLEQGTEIRVQVVNSHSQARDRTQAFLAVSTAPALVIAGGGSGTLRAVVEGVCAGSGTSRLPGPERVRIAVLRMGSGNPVARQFGVPCDPEEALKGILANLLENRTAPCCVMRCKVDNTDFHMGNHYGVTMMGFGQFGRSPGDLARWHRRLPLLRRMMAGLLGIERLNNLEYGLSLLIRFAWCALKPGAVENVEVRIGGRVQSMRLLAGVVMNFPFSPLPFEPGVSIEDAALSLNLIPYTGRWTSLCLLLSPRRIMRSALQMRVTESDCVEIRSDQDAVEFFIDEDPVVFHGSVRIRVAGTLAFVPGGDFRWPRKKGG